VICVTEHEIIVFRKPHACNYLIFDAILNSRKLGFEISIGSIRTICRSFVETDGRFMLGRVFWVGLVFKFFVLDVFFYFWKFRLKNMMNVLECSYYIHAFFGGKKGF